MKKILRILFIVIITAGIIFLIYNYVFKVPLVQIQEEPVPDFSNVGNTCDELFPDFGPV